MRIDRQIVFRWSVWGAAADLLELLLHSVGTFHRWFGSSAHYVVCTDQRSKVIDLFNGLVEVVSVRGSPFDVAARAPWRKWGPAVRLFPGRTEIYVDSDIFVIGDPYELRQFANEPGDAFMAMQEARKQPLYGLFKDLVAPDLPAINAGLFAQQPRADLTDDLLRQLTWWKGKVEGLGGYHDEQGAVAAALAGHFQSSRARVLPRERYMIVSPWSNSELQDLSEIAIIHATCPNHPAFTRFRRTILANSDFA